MKPIFLEFKDNDGKVTETFSTCSLKTGIMDNIFDIAESAEDLNRDNVEIKEVKEFYKQLKAIIVEVFGNKFTVDDLNKNVEQEDLMKVFKNLSANLRGDMSKK